MKKLYFTLAVTAALYAPFSYGNIDDLKALIDKGDVKKAYEYALSIAPDFEGSPDFDYLYGLAAVESSNPNEAIFAFDRVLLREPNHRAAKVELARAYYLSGNYEQSEQLFNESLQANPPKEAQENIKKYLALIEQKKAKQSTGNNNMKVGGKLFFGVGINDNINSSPGIEQGFIGSSLINIDSDNTKEVESVYNNIGALVGGSKLFANKHALLWGTSINGVYNHQDSQYNRTIQSFRVSMKHAVSDNHVLSYGANLSTFIRESLHYRNSYGGNINWDWLPQKNKKISLGLFSSQSDHKDVRITNGGVESLEDPDISNSRDVNANGLSLRFVQTSNDGIYTVSMGSSFAQRRVVSENLVSGDCTNCLLYDRNTLGWDVGLNVKHNKKHAYGVGYQFLNSRYKNLPFTSSSSGDEKRRDTLHVIRLSHNWKFTENWILKSHLQRIDNRANFEVNKFNRTDLGTTVEYLF